MSKRFYRVGIEDVYHYGCREEEVEALLDTFESTVKKMASTLARKAWYELRDFAGSEGKGIQGFSLVIERVDMQRQEQWHGVFGCEGRKLNLIATLERN